MSGWLQLDSAGGALRFFNVETGISARVMREDGSEYVRGSGPLVTDIGATRFAGAEAEAMKDVLIRASDLRMARFGPWRKP
jgi:hypothetical protein